MKITILAENIANKRGLLAEHGLSILIETGTHRILFDTGQSDVFLHNADKMGISYENLDGIVLSHGHYDHTGGLEYFTDIYNKKKVKLFMREDALNNKVCRNSDGKTFRKIGIPWRERKLPVEYYYTKEKEEIFPDVFVVSDVPSIVAEEPLNDIFFMYSDESGCVPVPDYMADEQMLVFRTCKGLAIFAGCAHPGILNCIEHIKKNFPGEKLYFLLAGMHLRSCSTERIERTIGGLQQCKFEKIVPVHCTGIEAIVKMKERMGEKCKIGEVGMRMEI